MSNILFYVHPEEMIQFDEHVCFKWVGSTTNMIIVFGDASELKTSNPMGPWCDTNVVYGPKWLQTSTSSTSCFVLFRIPRDPITERQRMSKGCTITSSAMYLFRFLYHSQKVIGSLGYHFMQKCLFHPKNASFFFLDKHTIPDTQCMIYKYTKKPTN